MSKKLILLFYTVRFLKPIQFYWRVCLKVKQFFPFSDVIQQPIAIKVVSLSPCIDKYPSFSERQFCFLNEKVQTDFPIAWNDAQRSKLWLYNLHYFDYINQSVIDNSVALDLMQDWVKQNPVGTGNGWEPYTLSLRVVNWIKFFVRNDIKTEDFPVLYNSLFLQVRFLFRHLEYHLLGNHLFKNGIALVFTGAFFEGKEAHNWLQKGRQIIISQINEQVLVDGGHFERSPMYHLLILEDILDCLNISQGQIIFSDAEIDALKNRAEDMLGFLKDILHPDGEIPFFNDSALHIAPVPADVFRYSSRLGIQNRTSSSRKHILEYASHPWLLDSSNQKLFDESGSLTVIEKPDSGYFVLQNNLCKLIVDAGAIGPDYLPGHAHCDTLSYELSIGSQRCIVNSGTYQYAGEERNDFRATAAHNTVTIDKVEQHEIWSTFRVARRGYPFDVSIEQKADSIFFSAAHNGYKRLPRKLVHRRQMNFQEKYILIEDVIEGRGEHLAESYIHLHPEVEVTSFSEQIVECKQGLTLFTIEVLEGLKFVMSSGWYSSEFGVKQRNKVLVLRRQSVCPFSLVYRIVVEKGNI